MNGQKSSKGNRTGHFNFKEWCKSILGKSEIALKQSAQIQSTRREIGLQSKGENHKEKEVEIRM